MNKTPTANTLPKRYADFATLSKALDYAAQGCCGINFYHRGKLKTALTYAELREKALNLAKRLSSLNVSRGSRIALLADTDPDFHIFFFACQYAGLIPVPIPVQFRIGSKKENIAHARWLIESSKADLAMAPKGCQQLLQDSTEELKLEASGDSDFFNSLPKDESVQLTPSKAHETAYLQFTSGSTKFPRGVQITQSAVMHNLGGITRHGLQVEQTDRCVSWLPFYHDMGLVGFVLGPMASQISVDYFSPQKFIMRPQIWLSLISRNKASISFAPPFGYELCSRRIKKQNSSDYDLTSWRIAGVGADAIHPEPLLEFARILKSSGFDQKSFLACYGLAECSLAVSFAPLKQGLQKDCCDKKMLSENGLSIYTNCNPQEEIQEFVKCGRPLPDLDIQICDQNGNKLKERECGTLYVKGPSVMQGYADLPQETEKILSKEGWLNTGDLAYIAENEIVITGRSKDMLVINGRNIWPQDLENIAVKNIGIRPTDALAFSVFDDQNRETAVLVIQSKENSLQNRENLLKKIKTDIYHELGIKCYIELVPLHTLPRTTSGKPSRSKAKKQFLERCKDLDLSTSQKKESKPEKENKTLASDLLSVQAS